MMDGPDPTPIPFGRGWESHSLEVATEEVVTE